MRHQSILPGRLSPVFHRLRPLGGLRLVIRGGAKQQQNPRSTHSLRGTTSGAVENEGSPPYLGFTESLLVRFLAVQIPSQFCWGTQVRPCPKRNQGRIHKNVLSTL